MYHIAKLCYQSNVITIIININKGRINEKEIYIGDELKIGNCLFQISQPRIPCYKIGIKMNSRDFPKKFSQSGLLGSYLRVLETGSISRDDEVEYIKKKVIVCLYMKLLRYYLKM